MSEFRKSTKYLIAFGAIPFGFGVLAVLGLYAAMYTWISLIFVIMAIDLLIP